MGNIATQTFTDTGTWTAPAGVTQVKVVAQKNAQSLLSGDICMVFLDPVGNAWAVGDNSNGGLGIGLDPSTNSAFSSPIKVLGSQKFISVNAQENNVNSYRFGLTNQGKLFSWGANGIGQLGDGTVVDKSSPVAVIGGLTFAVIDTNASSISYGLTPNGLLYAWGSNNTGRLGTNQDPATVLGVSSPVQVVGGQIFKKIKSTATSMYAINTAGAMYAWGINSNGQVGDGTVVQKSSPVAVVGGVTFKDFSFRTGIDSAGCIMALGVNGSAYAWGANTFGQVGDNTTTSKSSPIQVLGGLTFTKLFSANGQSNYGITTAGDLYAWGRNTQGQLGDGSVVPKSSPVLVLGGLKWSTIYPIANGAGANITVLGITTSGVAYAWGDNLGGGLGTNQSPGTVAAVSSPVAVVGGLTFAQVGGTYNGGGGGTSSWGLTTDGKLYSWGQNGTGQLGDNTIVSKSSPVAVVGSATGVGTNLINSLIIPVVPGTNYSVSFNQMPATFGTTQLANFVPDAITLIFEQ